MPPLLVCLLYPTASLLAIIAIWLFEQWLTYRRRKRLLDHFDRY